LLGKEEKIKKKNALGGQASVGGKRSAKRSCEKMSKVTDGETRTILKKLAIIIFVSALFTLPDESTTSPSC